MPVVYPHPEAAHKAAIEHVLTYGTRTRGTTELVGQAFTMKAPMIDRLYVPRPGADHRIGVVEGCQLIAGEAWPQLLSQFGKLANFMDGQIFAGAYGPRAEKTIDWACRELNSDWGSRRAFASVWQPTDGFVGEASSRDVPCTIGFQFLTSGSVGDGLDMVVYMRSSDLWWGWTYDIVQFAMLHASVAFAGSVRPANMTIMAGSLHVYDRNADQAVEYANSPLSTPLPVPGWEDEPCEVPCHVSHRRLPIHQDSTGRATPLSNQRLAAREVLHQIAADKPFEGTVRESAVSPWLKEDVNRLWWR